MAGQLVGHPAADRAKHKFLTFELDFLAILLLRFALSIFSNGPGSNLSNRLGPISLYALLKNLRSAQGRPHEHPNLGKPENLEF